MSLRMLNHGSLPPACPHQAAAVGTGAAEESAEAAGGAVPVADFNGFGDAPDTPDTPCMGHFIGKSTYIYLLLHVYKCR